MSFATLMIASTLANTAGMYAQGQAQAAAYEANATAAEQAARAQREKAAFEARRVREQGQSVLATQRARYGFSGVAMTGSPLDVALSTVRKNELDALMARYNGEVAARQNENQASVYRSMASSARTAGTIGAVTTLLTGAAEVGLLSSSAGGSSGMMAPASTGASAMAQPDPFRWRIPGWN